MPQRLDPRFTGEVDRLVLDAISRGWPRRAAEFAVKKLLKRTTSTPRAIEILSAVETLKSFKPTGQPNVESFACPPRAPRSAKERMERALGPDDGRPRRGGSPVLQGGSPGLGKRR